MSITGSIWQAINERGFLFDAQQRWTSANYQAMWREFRPLASPHQRILDLGCATSGCVQRIWEGLDPQYVGADLTFGYLKWGQRRYPQARLVRADIGALPFRKGPFDFVCTFSVLHHVDDATVRALGRQLGELLSPEARVLVAEPVFPPESPSPRRADRLSRFLLKHDRGRHIRNAEGYASLLSDGLVVTRFFPFMYGIHHFCGFELRRRRGV